MVEMLKSVFKNLFRKPATLRYPYEKRPLTPGYRGRFELIPTECIMCTMCEKSCPADAIKIDKEAKKYKYDPLKCIGCGYCVERCPKDCIMLKPEYTSPMRSHEIVEWAITLTPHKEAILSLKDYKGQEYAKKTKCTPLVSAEVQRSLLERFSDRQKLIASLGSFIRCPEDMIRDEDED